MEFSVSQKKYVFDLLKETSMSGYKPSDTPVDPNKKLGDAPNEVLIDKVRYQCLVGKLIYLFHTRLDIAFAVSVVSQFMHSPYEKYLKVVYKILKDLQSTSRKGLLFKKSIKRV